MFHLSFVMWECESVRVRVCRYLPLPPIRWIVPSLHPRISTYACPGFPACTYNSMPEIRGSTCQEQSHRSRHQGFKVCGFQEFLAGSFEPIEASSRNIIIIMNPTIDCGCLWVFKSIMTQLMCVIWSQCTLFIYTVIIITTIAPALTLRDPYNEWQKCGWRTNWLLILLYSRLANRQLIILEFSISMYPEYIHSNSNYIFRILVLSL